MPRLNHARAVALVLGACGALAGPPLEAARLVQDGVIVDGVPPPDARLAAALARYAGASEARLLDWTSDGALLVARRADGAEQLLRLDGDAAHARELGARTPALRAAAVQSYHSDYVATLAAPPASSADDPALSIVPLGPAGPAGTDGPVGTGAAKVLVEAASLPGTPAWAHDDHRLAFSAALRDAAHRDLYALDTSASAGPRLIASGDAGAWQVLDWTSADRALLVRHELAGGGDELLLVDVESGSARRVETGGKDAAPVRIREARLAADDRGLYFIAAAADGGSYGRLQYVDLYGNNGAAPLPPDAVHELGHFDLGAGGKLIAYSWNEAGYDRVAIYDRESGRATTVAGLPPGAVDALRFDRAAGRLAVEVAPAVAPRDVYVADLAGAQVARWTTSHLGDVGVGQVVAPLTVRFATWDRPGGSARTLSALYYRARGAGAHPVLLLLGAPDLRAQYDPFVQYCVNELGFAVVQPQLRDGAAGVLDLGALLAWIGVQPDLQRDGVVALGRAAAGTLALEASGLYNDRIRAAVSIDGMATADQLTLVRHPVLLVQGLAQPALDAASAEQLLWRLRSAKIESGFVAPRDRRPTLASAAERAAAWRVIAQFLAQFLAQPKGAAPGG